MTTVGYDCGAQPMDQSHINTYSLLDVNPCLFEKAVKESKKFLGQIVQTKVYEYRTVFQCKVKLLRNIRRCGWFSHLELAENGLVEYLIEVSQEQCKRIHDTNSFSYDSQHVLTDLRVNQTSRRTLYLAGNARNDACNVGTFSGGYGTWDEVNV